MVIGLGVSGKRLATDLVGDAAVVVKDMKEAVDAARKAAVEGDIVLLSPATSSFDQYSGFEERGRHFKQLVNAL
jgi:UDP-N-acetylmuramoylalanine--D-glutamate ligase